MLYGISPVYSSFFLCRHVPPRSDLVFVDYAINGGTAEQLLTLFRLLNEQAARHGTHAPLVVLTNNFFWCRTPEGESGRDFAKRTCGTFHTKQCISLVAPFCRSATFSALQKAPRCEEALLEHAVAPCGATVLSSFEPLIAAVGSGMLNVSQISRDGMHPAKCPSDSNNKHCGSPPLKKAWRQLLTAWFDLAVPPADTGRADSGDVDIGAADTGAADTGAADNGAADTGASDTGAVAAQAEPTAEPVAVAANAAAAVLPADPPGAASAAATHGPLSNNPSGAGPQHVTADPDSDEDLDPLADSMGSNLGKSGEAADDDALDDALAEADAADWEAATVERSARPSGA